MSDWTDQELKAAIQAYFAMLQKEIDGESYIKAEVNRDLRSGVLAGRSRGSVEFRMQNISAALLDLCSPTITGYLPRANVGANVTSRIRRIIFDEGLLDEANYQPTDDPDQLDTSVANLLENPISGVPQGQSSPKKTRSESSSYERDPLVKAWVLQNADGICEYCDKPAPFVGKSGNPYLEVHHVTMLSNGGADTTANAVALCPNCHRQCHHGADHEEMASRLKSKVERVA